MIMLVFGLIVFLGLHSLRIVADDWRKQQIARIGLHRWKGFCSIVALIGIGLIIWGFGLARQHPVLVYAPPLWLRHLNSLFMLVALIFLAAARVPRNHIKARLGHPQVLAVKTWSFGHLLATGMLHDLVLFAPFLVWSVVFFIVSRRRDRRDSTVYPAGTVKGDALAVVMGVAVWTLFAFWLHNLLFGVNPLT
ncbi:NnrU family protein [Dyella sp. M7H15-1]|nr:NnrU family protein [Dyella sp. M7H15-1]